MTAAPGDRFAAAQAVADATVYEGYVLYPYRATSPKNQTRWNFGVLAPPAYVAQDGSERSAIRVECLAQAPAEATVYVRVRYLHLQRRTVAVAAGTSGQERFAAAEVVDVDGTPYRPWDEAVDVTEDLPPIPLPTIAGGAAVHLFATGGGEDAELLRRSDGAVAGRITRRREAVAGTVTVTSSPAGAGLVRLRVDVANTTPCPTLTGRDDALAYSLLAAHVMVGIDDGRFLSLLDPPASGAAAAHSCHSDGTYPVLVDSADRVVLSAPIILYDHPQVAPESPGDLYDATEIDEILALRVVTLTDAEKAEARATDPRAAAVIDRCGELSPAAWERLHGTFRPVEDMPAAVPWWDPDVEATADPETDSVSVAGFTVAKGSAVRLRPSRRADAQDLFLRDRVALVAGVFRDLDDNAYVAVTLADDPAAAEFDWQGRYLYFAPDELEVLADPAGTP